MPESVPHLRKVAASFCAVLKCPVMHVGIRTAGDRIAEISYLPISVPPVAPRNRLAERAAGSLGGFAHHGEGFHLEIKRWLLCHEHAVPGQA